ncbi:MAG: TRAP transporter small permease [Candidatus Accumulibacter sp.]|jgi:TRAP-type C4-dicarboxylate transport system permease small subunit|nr:TRAP transporter small permease [Accumulibacter sp.]
MNSNNDKRGEGRLASFERALMAVSMGALCLLTMANVLVRYFTDISFAFTEEISIVLMVVMTLVGASHAFTTRHHIAILYFAERWAVLRRIAPRFAAACSLLMFGLLTFYGARMAWDDYDFEVTSPSLGVPQWWYTIWLPILSLLIVLRLIGLLRRGGR